MIKKTIGYLSLTMIGISSGCSAISRIFVPPTTTFDQALQTMDSPIATCSPMLGWLGGICTLAGMAMLVLTGGRLGWRPVIGGVLFIVLNYALAMYASWFFLPVVIATAAISLAWAGKIVYRIINDDKIKLKEMLK
jgi:hypothetical protein